MTRSLIVGWLIFTMLTLSGCGAALPERPERGRHLSPPAAEADRTEIPAIVPGPPVLTPPAPEPELELYTVVVQDVPVRELLFAMARDAALNIDIHPDISGNVTLNAIDQTLPQILTRLARQVNIRWDFQPPNLVITPDLPYLHTYRIDYVNISRKSTGKVSVSTSIATTGATPVGGGGGGGGGSNDSTTSLEQQSNNLFWETILNNLRAILGETATGSGEAGGGADGGAAVSNSIIGNPEAGLIAVRATSAQHAEIQRFLDQILSRSLKQVLIEATVVEVALNDQYQAGVDWSALSLTGKDTYGITQSLTGDNLASAPVTTLVFDRLSSRSDLNVTIRMLEQFGDLKVLSTPKVMALNNQTAILKVVDNNVYFTIDVDINTEEGNSTVTYTSNVHTVPIGFVMAVTPQINDHHEITLNIRPTISRILGYVNDPNPALAQVNVISRIPEIQVREVESILKVNSGQVAVLGGLMQDSIQKNNAGVPLLSRLPVVGDLFTFKDDTTAKTELIIFLRPTIIRLPSLDGDLRQYREFLPDQLQPSLFPRPNILTEDKQ